MADGKIVVELNVNVKGESGQTDNLDLSEQQTQPGEQQTPIDAKTQGKAVNNSTGKMIATYLGTQAVRWGLSNYGQLTGDYLTQTALQDTTTMVGLGVAMIQSPIMGGVAAATVLATSGINRLVEMGNQERRANSITERVGTIISTGGRDL